MILIIGGSGSGKSAFAESLVTSISEPGERYYLATMEIYDDEMLLKVERHRKMRAEKGFNTIECPKNILSCAKHFKENTKTTALLECMSNLVANEMFSGLENKPADYVSDDILKQIFALDERLENLIIVSNNVFEDGVEYDDATKEYISALGQINCSLAAKANLVVELIAGIPVARKGILPKIKSF